MKSKHHESAGTHQFAGFVVQLYPTTSRGFYLLSNFYVATPNHWAMDCAAA